MLRVLFLVLLVSGIWATWKSVADWRTADSAQTLGQEAGRRAEIVFGVPSELMSPAGWADIAPRVEAVQAQDATMPDRAAVVGATAAVSIVTQAAETPAEPTQTMKKTSTSTSAAFGMPDEAQLVAAIQTELKTLGFYRGSVDNIWGRRSRSAVVAFNANQGAALDPEPSEALYTAVKTAAMQRQETTAANSTPSGNARADVKTASYLPPASFRGGEKTTVNAAASPATQPRPRVYRAKRERVEPVRRQTTTWRRERSVPQQLRNNGIAWPGFF